MIDFSGYTKAKIEADMLAQVDPDIDTREGSMVQTPVGAGAWEFEDVYLKLDKVQKNAYSDTAEGADLNLVAKTHGVSRKAATPAVRQGAFLDDSNNPVTIAAGSRFKTINGEDSVVFVSGDLISAGVYELTCETPGIIGNSYTGAILPITAINGLATAVIGTIITVGAEEETDPALRVRYDNSFTAEAFGGNIAAYRQKILSIAGVGAVQVYPNSPNPNNVRCVILDDGLEPASAALIQEVQTIICPPYNSPSSDGYGYAPIGATVTISTANQTTIDVACTITWEAGHGGAGDIQNIKDAIAAYLLDCTETWGDAIVGYSVTYNVNIYLARVTAAILAVEGVVNVTGVTLNGSAADISLTEVYNNSNIPLLGTVTIS